MYRIVLALTPTFVRLFVKINREEPAERWKLFLNGHLLAARVYL